MLHRLVWVQILWGIFICAKTLSQLVEVWLLIIILNCGKAKVVVFMASNGVQMVADVGSNTFIFSVVEIWAVFLSQARVMNNLGWCLLTFFNRRALKALEKSFAGRLVCRGNVLASLWCAAVQLGCGLCSRTSQMGSVFEVAVQIYGALTMFLRVTKWWQRGFQLLSVLHVGLMVLGVLRKTLTILRFNQKIDIFEVFKWIES